MCELAARFALALLASNSPSGINCESLPALCDSMVELLVEAQQQHCYYVKSDVDNTLTSVEDLRPTLASALAALMAATAPPLKNRKKSHIFYDDAKP